MAEESVNVKVVRAFLPPLGFDLTLILQRNASPAIVAEAMAGFRPMLADDFVATFDGSDKGEREGVEGLREVWLDWMAPWESYRVLEHKLVDIGNDRVVALTRNSARAHDKSEEEELRGAAIFTVRGRQIARADYFARPEDGLAAAGAKSPQS